MLIEPKIIETENCPDIILISEDDGIYINTHFSDDRRLRRIVYGKVLQAKEFLPDDLTFMIFEAYRPRARQIQMWDDMWSRMVKDHPHANDEEITALCDNFIANPHHVGSGHQFGCSIDITLCTKDGVELDMGTGVQEFCEKTKTENDLISKDQKANRKLLCDTLEKVGLINYPSEWWHYSYGDRLWAILTGRTETLYGVLPF